MEGSRTLNAFSVDVEDWYQSSFNFDSPISSICVDNTRRVLRFLSSHGVKGTFFVQGMVAKAFPFLVKEIHQSGHEIGSHGFSHRPVNKMKPKKFFEELKETRDRLEDITGERIKGFRAPDFTIDANTFWAFEVMIETGLTYDSSIFPVRTRRYGIQGFKPGYSIIKTPSGSIEELTVSVYETRSGLKIPVGGGGYIRLLPSWFLKWCLQEFHKKKKPFVLYCHPYEFNPQEWKDILKYVPRLRKLHQGIGRRNFSAKISSLLQTDQFGSISDVLKRCRFQS